jgi:PAS domain S-box-containing protein
MTSMTLSIVLAMLAWCAALVLARQVTSLHGRARVIWLGAGTTALGAGIWTMHYTGISMIGVVAIGASSLLVLGVAIASAFFGRFMAVQKVDLSASRERELYFQTMAEAVPEIIWTADPDGMDDYFNRQCFDYTGLTIEQLRGTGWEMIIHPDDLDGCLSKWKNALRTGDPYDVEYRLRGKGGAFRWFLCRANPIRDPKGEIVKWFGTCTDIESQKQNQQILEEQILERTMQLADANSRLQEEMAEKDMARRELDQQNERMMKELERRSERATMLAKMGELLQSCISREEVIAAALGFAPRIFPAARGALALLNASRSLAEVIGSWTECQLPTMEFEPTACWALRTGHPHLVVAGDLTAPCAHAAGVRSAYLCIPILAQGETLGILHLQATEEGPQLDASELTFKTTFAGQVGLSIANIKTARSAAHPVRTGRVDRSL